MSNKTAGTKEWANSNINIYSGCSNNCRYCYAKRMAIRFGRKTDENWHEMVINDQQMLNILKIKKRKGTIMFPSSHDITPETVSSYIIALHRILEAGNRVLIVSKADTFCIHEIINTLSSIYLDQVEFRITIGSKSNNLLKFWEPNAPTFEERLESIKIVSNAGFKVSVSIEPYLDSHPSDLLELIGSVYPFVSTIWIGKMSGLSKNTCGDLYRTMKRITDDGSVSALISIVVNSIFADKIRWKDSIQNVMKKNQSQIFLFFRGG